MATVGRHRLRGAGRMEASRRRFDASALGTKDGKLLAGDRIRGDIAPVAAMEDL